MFDTSEDDVLRMVRKKQITSFLRLSQTNHLYGKKWWGLKNISLPVFWEGRETEASSDEATA